MPVTAKVRLSPKGESEINIFEIADAIQDAGVEMLTIHGRTTNARYSKAADWYEIDSLDLFEKWEIFYYSNISLRQFVLGISSLKLRIEWTFQSLVMVIF